MTTDTAIWPRLAPEGATANVEFVSATPTGPLSFQDIYAGVTGDALSRVMARCGWKTTREFYVNDAGAPVTALARAVHALLYRLAEGEAPGPELSPYMAELMADLLSRDAQELVTRPEEEWLPALRSQIVAFTLAEFREVFDRYGIRIDTFTHESALTANRQPHELLQHLKARGLLIETPEPDAPRPRIDLATSRFGDTEDHPLRMADGGWTYFMGDVLYHVDKLARGYDALVTLFRPDHAAYGARILATVAALAEDREVMARICLLDPVAPDLSGARGNEVLLAFPQRVLRCLLLSRETDETVTLDATEETRQRADRFLARLDAVLDGAEAATAARPAPDLATLVAAWPDRVAETFEDMDVTRLARTLDEITRALAATPRDAAAPQGREIAAALAEALGLD